MARQQVTRAAGRSMQTTMRRAPGEARSRKKRPSTTPARPLNPRAAAKAQRRAKERAAGNPRH